MSPSFFAAVLGIHGIVLWREREHDSPESLPGMQQGFMFLNYQLAIPRLKMSAQSLLPRAYFFSPSAAVQTVLEEAY